MIDCDSTDDIVCPYCGNKQDGTDYHEASTLQCYDCRKWFKFDVEYSKYFSSEEVACLNGGEHVWKPVRGQTAYPDARHCTACEKYEWGTERT